MTPTTHSIYFSTCDFLRAGPISCPFISAVPGRPACLKGGGASECFWKEYFLAIPDPLYALVHANSPDYSCLPSLVLLRFFVGVLPILDHRCPHPLGRSSFVLCTGFSLGLLTCQVRSGFLSLSLLIFCKQVPWLPVKRFHLVPSRPVGDLLPLFSSVLVNSHILSGFPLSKPGGHFDAVFLVLSFVGLLDLTVPFPPPPPRRLLGGRLVCSRPATLYLFLQRL